MYTSILLKKGKLTTLKLKSTLSSYNLYIGDVYLCYSLDLNLNKMLDGLHLWYLLFLTLQDICNRFNPQTWNC